MNQKDQEQQDQRKILPWKTVAGSLTLLAVMVAVVYLILLNYQTYKQTVISQTQRQLQTVAKTTAERLEEFIVEHMEALKTIALNPAVQEEVARRIRHDQLYDDYCQVKALYEIHQNDMDALTILDVDGVLLHRHPFRTNCFGMDLMDKPGVTYVIKEHKSYVSEMFYNKLGKPAISISEPVFYGGQFAGLVRWMVQIDTLSKLFFEPIKVGLQGYVWSFNDKGIILSHPQEGYRRKPGHLLNS